MSLPMRRNKTTMANLAKESTMRFLGLLLVAAFVAVQTSHAQAPTPTPRPRPVGAMKDLMSKIIYPTSDAIFYVSTRTPADDHEWEEFETKVLTLGEMANILMMPGRARDDDKWMKDAQLLLDASLKAYKLAVERNVEGLSGMNEQL